MLKKTHDTVYGGSCYMVEDGPFIDNDKVNGYLAGRREKAKKGGLVRRLICLFDRVFKTEFSEREPTYWGRFNETQRLQEGVSELSTQEKIAAGLCLGQFRVQGALLCNHPQDQQEAYFDRLKRGRRGSLVQVLQGPIKGDVSNGVLTPRERQELAEMRKYAKGTRSWTTVDVREDHPVGRRHLRLVN